MSEMLCRGEAGAHNPEQQVESPPVSLDIQDGPKESEGAQEVCAPGNVKWEDFLVHMLGVDVTPVAKEVYANIVGSPESSVMKFVCGICLIDGVWRNREKAQRCFNMIGETGDGKLFDFDSFLREMLIRDENRLRIMGEVNMIEGAEISMVQFVCGICLEYGVVENTEQAATCFKMAADEGHIQAQVSYGLCLRHEIGVAYWDAEESMRYIKMAADRGNADGQFTYGICLEERIGVPIDLEEACRYYKLAMEQGHMLAKQAFTNLSELMTNDVMSLVTNFSAYGTESKNGRKVYLIPESGGDFLAVRRFIVSRRFSTRRVLREIGLLVSLNHRCVERFISWRFQDLCCFRTMQFGWNFMSNGSLRRVLFHVKNGKNIPGWWTHDNISRIIVDMIIGLRYLHSRGIIHGNMKPSNILIDDEYRGIINDIANDRFREIPTHPQKRRKNDVIIYHAPEVAWGRRVPTEKIDVYAFGLILYEMIVGRDAFQKMSQYLEMLLNQTRPVIPETVNHFIAEIMQECWSENPEDRPSFHALYDKLKAARFPFYDDISNETIRKMEDEC
jgi:hypothetical protein